MSKFREVILWNFEHNQKLKYALGFNPEFLTMGKYDEIQLEVHDYTEDELKKLGPDKTIQFLDLIQWMHQNFDSIFEKAPKRARYAVVVHKESQEPEIYYFRHRIERIRKGGALDFQREQNNLDKITYLLYRNERDCKYPF